MDHRKLREQNRNRQMADNLQRRTQASPYSSTPGQPDALTSRFEVETGMRRQSQYRQSVAPQAGAEGTAGRRLEEKFQHGILSGFDPGNIGDINRAIWPFCFQFQSGSGLNNGVDDVLPGQSQTLQFSVSQEAGFLMRTISHSTFRLRDDGVYEYIDPFYYDESTNSPNGLVFSLEDAQSTRNFNGRQLREIATLGNANFPWTYPSTVFLLPNQTMLLNITNSGTETYRTFVSVWGYRIRVEDAQQILSTVSLRGK